MFELDGNDYPTDMTLKSIREWGRGDGSWKNLMEEISFLFDAHGRCEYSEEDKTWKISTGGWSGCEDVIDALSENIVFWMFCWKSSRVGGHFEFETRRVK